MTTTGAQTDSNGHMVDVHPDDRSSTVMGARGIGRKATSMSPYSRILFPRPSFLEGMARIFDFRGILSSYNLSRTPSEADARAIRADWQAVGDDLWTALEQADEDYKSAKEAMLSEQSQAT